jgi:hypothetical protein
MWGQNRDPCGVNMSIQVNVGSMWGQYVNTGQRGVHVGSICQYRGQCGVNMGSMWGQYGINVGSIWGQYGINVGSIWGQYGINVGSIRGCSTQIESTVQHIEVRAVQQDPFVLSYAALPFTVVDGVRYDRNDSHLASLTVLVPSCTLRLSQPSVPGLTWRPSTGSGVSWRQNLQI